MAEGSAAGGARYRAFISYSHRDAVLAARLHRRLEGYVLPKRLGTERQLTPIFKDREELPAAHDLSTQVRAALAVSDCLIVVCSPDAAASPWVGREIELFRELHPDRSILAALVRGEPAEAFPAALSLAGVEPLAADFRKEADGERLALLKLVAGLAGVGVNQLIQRDAQRRLRGVMAVTAVSLAAVVAMGGMTVFALNARTEAERQRTEAEGLVEFMLTELREKLKGAGSLRVRSAVNDRALAYYSHQNLAGLPSASLERRARLLLALGEDDVARGDLGAARAQFEEAYRVTEALLKASPDHPDRVWAHSQSNHWRGYVEYASRRTAKARTFWENYRQLSLKLDRLEPGTVRSLRERAYAENNLCSLFVEQEKNAASAVRTCRSALTLSLRVAAKMPTEMSVALDTATSWGWLADAEALAGNLPGALDGRLRQEAMLDALLRREPDNAQYLENWGNAQRGLSRLAYLQGNLSDAKRRLQRVHKIFRPLALADPDNQLWRDQTDYAEKTMKWLDIQQIHGAEK